MSIWFSVIILAVIQGITEFLPVSSSGHLAVLGQLFGLQSDEGLAFSIVLHAGSLVAIVVFYFKTLLSLLKKENLRVWGQIIIGTIPAGIGGVLLKMSGYDEVLFRDIFAIGISFLITASLLRLTGKNKFTGNAVTPLEKISWKQSLIIGLSQMFAILPGISRSGTTIAVGTFTGLQFEAAATFSFLLALPAIGGAALLEMISLCKSGFSIGKLSYLQLGTGFFISAAVSFAALSLLVAIVKRRKISMFSWYMFALGITVVAWQMIKLSR